MPLPDYHFIGEEVDAALATKQPLNTTLSQLALLDISAIGTSASVATEQAARIAADAGKQPLNATLTKLAANTTIQSATLYVDAASAVTGVRGDPFSPFATLAAAVAAASAGDTIVMRPGSYVSPGVIALNKAGLTINGAGSTIQGANTADVTRFNITADNVSIIGLKIDGLRGSSTTLTAPAINIQNANRALIRGVTFVHHAHQCINITGASDSVHVEKCEFSDYFNAIFSENDGSAAPTRLTIDDCYFHDGYSNGAYTGAVKLKSSIGSYVAEHRISNCRMKLPGQMGVEMQGGTDRSEVVNCFISGAGSDYVDNKGFGISFSSQSDCVAKGCTIWGCYYLGIEDAGSTNIQVLDCVIDGRNAAGTTITQFGIQSSNTWNRLIVEGGSISNCADNAIHTLGGNDVQVRGVAIKQQTANYVINIQGTSKCLFSNCAFDANGPLKIFFIDFAATNISDANITGNKVLSGSSLVENFIGCYSPSGAHTFAGLWIHGNDFYGAYAPLPIGYQVGGGSTVTDQYFYNNRGGSFPNTYNTADQGMPPIPNPLSAFNIVMPSGQPNGGGRKTWGMYREYLAYGDWGLRVSSTENGTPDTNVLYGTGDGYIAGKWRSSDGTNGLTATGTFTNFTIKNGLITAAS